MTSPSLPSYDDTPTTTRTHSVFEEFASERERNGSEESPLLNNWVDPNEVTFSPFSESEGKENWPDSFITEEGWMLKEDRMRVSEVDVKESVHVEEFDLLANREQFNSFSELMRNDCSVDHRARKDALELTPDPSLEHPSPGYSPSDFLNPVIQYPTALNSSCEQEPGTPSQSFVSSEASSGFVSGSATSDLMSVSDDLVSRTSPKSKECGVAVESPAESSAVDNLIADICSLNIGSIHSSNNDKESIIDIIPAHVQAKSKPKLVAKAPVRPPSARITTRQQKVKTESPPRSAPAPKSVRVKRTMSAEQAPAVTKPATKPTAKTFKPESIKTSRITQSTANSKPTVESNNKNKKSPNGGPCCHKLHRKASFCNETIEKKKPLVKAKTLPEHQRPKTAPVSKTERTKPGPVRQSKKSKDSSLHRDIQPRSANNTPALDPTKNQHHRIKSANYSERKPLKKSGETQTSEEISEEMSALVDGLTDLKIEQSGSKTALVYDERMALHKNIWSKNHPERPGRVEETMRLLNECGILKRVRTVCAREVTKQEALRCHSEELWTTLESLEEMKPRDLYRLTDEFDSVYFNNNSFLAARLAAGSLISVTDEVLSGRAHNGVAVIRPPGHHAETDKPMGFCLLGNVPIACCHAMENYGLKRILVVDWDIHHGNGTQETFYNDARVLYVSLHRYDNGAFYPGGPGPHPDKIGGEKAKGYNMNIAWNQTHKKDGDYISAFHQLIMPVVQEFDPELVYISAGFDSGQGDPLGLTDVTPEGYSRMTHLLSNSAGGKVIVALEGGYKLSTVAEGMKSCTTVLLGEPPLVSDPYARVATPGGMKSILESLKHICPYWKNLAHYKEIFSLIPENTELVHQPPPEPQSFFDQSPVKARELIEEFKSPCIGMKDNGGLPEDEVDEEMAANSSADRKEPVKVSESLFAVQPRLWCPHLEEMVKPVPGPLENKPKCDTCQDDTECWYCLTCYGTFCSRYVQEHMLMHGIDSSHLLCLSMADLSVWCYGCDDYVHNEALLSAKNAGHIAKFGEPDPSARTVVLDAVQE